MKAHLARNWLIQPGATVASAMAAVLLTAPLAAGGEPSSPLFPPQATLYGSKMQEWSAQWWQYILSTPSNPNPLFDPTGNNCTLVQRGPVWFLEGVNGGTANRVCTVPEGKALFFPILNLVDINVTNQPAKELRAEIAGCLDSAYNLTLTIDGESNPIGMRHRVRSVPFVAVLPPGGVPTVPPTPPGVYSPAVDDGYYVMVRPLSVGPHTIRFTGASPGCWYAPTSFRVDPWSVDVSYELNVVPVSLK